VPLDRRTLAANHVHLAVLDHEQHDAGTDAERQALQKAGEGDGRQHHHRDRELRARAAQMHVEQRAQQHVEADVEQEPADRELWDVGDCTSPEGEQHAQDAEDREPRRARRPADAQRQQGHAQRMVARQAGEATAEQIAGAHRPQLPVQVHIGAGRPDFSTGSTGRSWLPTGHRS
jgi:hypothetical protein